MHGAYQQGPRSFVSPTREALAIPLPKACATRAIGEEDVWVYVSCLHPQLVKAGCAVAG